jgi:hypothetical protein
MVGGLLSAEKEDIDGHGYSEDGEDGGEADGGS